MKNKHTPGPWVVSRNGRDDVRVFAESVADSPRAVCRVNEPMGQILEANANANLIAGAPVLMDIARRWMDWATGPVVPIAVRMALQEDTRAAIARATGQTVMRGDASAFANVEAPAVSPTEDR